MEPAGWSAIGAVFVLVLGAVVAAVLKVGGFFREGGQSKRRDTIAELYAVIDLQSKRMAAVEARADRADENHVECEKRAARQEERIARLEDELTRLRAADDTGEHPAAGVEGADV